jgi:hypothetical protein
MYLATYIDKWYATHSLKKYLVYGANIFWQRANLIQVPDQTYKIQFLAKIILINYNIKDNII